MGSVVVPNTVSTLAVWVAALLAFDDFEHIGVDILGDDPAAGHHRCQQKREISAARTDVGYYRVGREAAAQVGHQFVGAFLGLARRTVEPAGARVTHDLRDLTAHVHLADAVAAGGSLRVNRLGRGLLAGGGQDRHGTEQSQRGERPESGREQVHPMITMQRRGRTGNREAFFALSSHALFRLCLASRPMIALRSDYEDDDCASLVGQVKEMFAPGGTLGQAKNFEFRPEQQQMGVAVARGALRRTPPRR